MKYELLSKCPLFLQYPEHMLKGFRSGILLAVLNFFICIDWLALYGFPH